MSILSIQSHVAYGYVGNRAATFPLQRLGHEVWAINTVQFSNHTGYGATRGEVFSAEHILDVVQGLADRGVLGECTALLSGYLGDASIGEAVLETLARLRQVNPDLLYCCDPVMGDYGRGFFVKPGIPEIMRKKILPASDIVTPNLFELEALADQKVRTVEDAKRALELIHREGPRVIVVTSFKPTDEPTEFIDMLVSDEKGTWRIQTPELPIDPAPNGAGDLTAALFLAHYLDTNDARTALELTTDSVFSVFEHTLKLKRRELALIDAQEEIVHPSGRFKAHRL